MRNNNIIQIRMPDDFHVHFRQGKELAFYVKQTARWCAKALVMPNTIPAIASGRDAQVYQNAIIETLRENEREAFTPLMTCKLYAKHTVADIREMKQAGVIACKLYPQGVTTHSEDGVSDPCMLADVYKEMEAQNMVLCIHGEQPNAFVLDRERKFLEVLANIQKIAPKLRIVLEHVSSAESVQYVCADTSSYLSATVTVHHALFTLDDMLGNNLNPHLFCKPVLKYPKDASAIQEVLLQENSKFFLGTDSAPHIVGKKECASGCAGVYSAPVALSLLTDFFYKKRHVFASSDGWIQALEKFTSLYGAEFYELSPNKQTVQLEKKTWKVPNIVDGVVPLCAGEELEWKLV